jgi:predicted CXXCH cytochrome family protein
MRRPALLVFLLCVTLAGALTALFAAGRRQGFLPGETSDGHYLMQASCGSCHEPFRGVADARCADCHRAELEKDTHPLRLFDDPRWVADLEHLDARHCRTCHREHRRAAGGVTVEPRFCFPCHDDVVEKRASHRGFDPAGCGAAGCHNYHDNSRLTSAYLEAHLDEPALLADWGLPPRAAPAAGRRPTPAPPGLASPPALVAAWEGGAHATAGVGCGDCHRSAPPQPAELAAACSECHGFEATSFGAGKHGVRLGLELAPLHPALARLPMRAPLAGLPALTCATCHDPHRVDTREAAVDACLRCHADAHSRSFPSSPHARLAAQPGARPGPREVTCASCHLPRVVVDDGRGGRRTRVNHNNTFTLRPPDRMAGLVCAACHGLDLALAALLEPGLGDSNYDRPPRSGAESLRLAAAARAAATGDARP